MSHGKQRSIAGALGLLTIAAALSGFIVYAVSLALFAQSAEARVISDAQRLTGSVARTVDSVLARPLAALRTMSTVQELHDNDRADLALVAEAILFGESLFRSISILDERGIVSGSYPAGSFLSGADLSEAAGVREARASGKPAWSRVYASLADGGRELSLVVPTKSGYIVGNLNFEVLAKTVLEAIEVERAEILIVDSGGTYVVNPNQEKVLSREGDPDFISERLLAPNASTYIYRRKTGSVEKLVLAERIPMTKWFILVERDAGFAAEALRSSLLSVSAAAALLVAFTSAFAVRTSRRLLHDVRAAVDYASTMIGPAEADPTEPRLPELRYRETLAVMEAALEAARRIKSRDEANRLLREALEELKRTQSALVESEKQALVGTLAANLAHELNTPLGAASSASAVLGGIEESELKRLLGSEAGGAEGNEALARIARLALSFDPLSASSPERRSEIRGMERALSAAAAPLGISLDFHDLADRLHDLGLRDCGGDMAAAILRAESEKRLAPFMDTAQALVQARILRIALERATMVVGAIRSYTRSGQNEALRRIDLSESLNSALALLYATMKRGVELTIEAAEGLVVLGKEDRLAQIWTNVLVNALEAMDYSGTVAIRTGKTGKESAFVEIEDSGVGIPSELREDVWKPLFSTKIRGKGTGLGLPIARKLVDELGGSIDFASEPGRTVFRIELPLADAPGGY